jgi:hypothetical protein
MTSPLFLSIAYRTKQGKHFEFNHNFCRFSFGIEIIPLAGFYAIIIDFGPLTCVLNVFFRVRERRMSLDSSIDSAIRYTNRRLPRELFDDAIQSLKRGTLPAY